MCFLYKNELPGKKVFEIDQLWIISDDNIGGLFKGQQDIQSKALLTPSPLLRRMHKAVTTAGNDGFMHAAQEGAGREKSFGLNILLPFEQAANIVIANDPKLVYFKYFFTRKLIFVKETHAFALFPGGFGTHDEAFEALTLLQTGKSSLMPVVFVDARIARIGTTGMPLSSTTCCNQAIFLRVICICSKSP